MAIIFNNDKYVPMHNHSRSSILDGLSNPSDMVKWAVENNTDVMAISDHGVLSGCVKFYKACKEHKIKPILAQEFYVSNPDNDAVGSKIKTGNVTNYHLLLLAYNQQGYQNLCRLSSWAWTEGHYYKPRIDFPHLAQYNEGLICSTACMFGAVGQIMLASKGPEAELDYVQRQQAVYERLTRYQELFGDRFYLELMDHGLELERFNNIEILKFSQAMGIKCIVTNDSHYVYPEHTMAQSLMSRITKSSKTKKVDDDDATSAIDTSVDSNENLYIKNKDQMAATFANYPDFTDYSSEIADRVEEVSPILDSKVYPAYLSTSLTPVFDQLSSLVWSELVERGLNSQEYQARLMGELQAIRDKGFADVFMIMWDVCKWADEQDIMRACRGSAASSLVLYLLDVTFLDPIKENLIFERFIDVERDEIPDIDTDWEPERREEVIEYIRHKYGGSDRVIQIQAFGTLGPKSVLNDLTKLTERKEGDTSAEASLMREISSRILTDAYGRDEENVVTDITLEYCFKNDKGDPETGKKSLAELIDSSPYTQQMWKCALAMEGAPRQGSVHAAGIVITTDDACNIIPLQMGTGMKTVVTQFDMNDLETVGVGKVDILSLNNLRVIAEAVRAIKKLPGYEQFNIRKIPLDDQKLYDFICTGHTRGIFQMEKDAFTKCVMQVKPQNFQELADMLALFRPGPLGDMDSGEISLKDEYVSRKHGKVAIVRGDGEDNKFLRYVNPTLYDILVDTYGNILYQEQVMNIAHGVAGLTRTEGYKIVKAISKKKRDLLVKWEHDFVAGAVNNGYNQQWVEKLWSSVEQFAGYSFNMAHAKSYALIAYWTMYLSYYFPREFFCAYLNSQEAGKVTEYGHKRDMYIAECYRRGIKVLTPDINESGAEYTITPDGIRYGLKAIKGIATSADHIFRERAARGPFISWEDFNQRILPRQVNSRMRTTLMEVGAFDNIKPGIRNGMTSKERSDAEAKYLGTVFDLSHIVALKQAYQQGVITDIDQLEGNKEYVVVGLVTAVGVRTAHVSRNQFGVGTLKDDCGSIEFVCFSTLWGTIAQDLVVGTVWAFRGTCDLYQGMKKQIKVSHAQQLDKS